MVRLRGVFILSSLVFPANAVSKLLLKGRSSDVEAFEEEDPCACLPWKQVYDAGLAVCGDGHERTEFIRKNDIVSGSWVARARARDTCSLLYEKVNLPLCLKIDPEGTNDTLWKQETWCWTSSKCESAAPANGTSSARVKICKRGEDPIMDEVPFTNMLMHLYNHKIDAGQIMRRLYPKAKDVSYSDIILTLDQFGEYLGEEMLGKLRALQGLNTPMLITTKLNDPVPFAIVNGTKICAFTEGGSLEMRQSHPGGVGQCTGLPWI